MTDFLSLGFLQQLQNIHLCKGNLNINGFSYPVFQQNGQKGIGPVQNIELGIFKPGEYENEIFIDRVPCYWTENDLMQYLMRVGIVYYMRFLVNFSGLSRGTAYVQYAGNTLPITIIERLNKIFHQENLQVCAQVSQNFRRLKIGNISVSLEEEQIIALFKQCRCIEFRLIIDKCKKTYILTFGNNRQACLARRFLVSQSDKFGASVFVVWHDKPKKKI